MAENVIAVGAENLPSMLEKGIGLTMKKIQVNTKFVNNPQPEWIRFVIVTKQAKDLHSVNFDQLKESSYKNKGTNTVSTVNANQSRVITANVRAILEKQCTTKKRVKDAEWFKEKMLLSQAQEAGVILHEVQQEFLVNSNVILYADNMVTIKNDVAQYVPPPEQDKNAMILSVIEHMKGQIEQSNMESFAKQDKYLEELADLEKAKKKLENC
nr:hypothetical protein [Tanacetum cinerariifolium]